MPSRCVPIPMSSICITIFKSALCLLIVLVTALLADQRSRPSGTYSWGSAEDAVGDRIGTS